MKDGLSGSPVTSIKFYASINLTNNRLAGVAKAAPWTVQWNHVPAGDYSLTAVATNKQGSTTSDPVAIQVEKPSVVTDQSSLTVSKGHTTSFGVTLSRAPSKPVTVHLSDSGTGTTVSKGQALTFTPWDWNRPQQVTVAAAQAKTGSHSTITASAAGLGNASVAVTAAASATGYDQWFLNLYDDITNPGNGYFSPLGIPYHSVEELIVEAPDYGHETTSETYSYWLWLAADYGRVSGDWTEFNTAWSNMQQYMIPNAANQPGCSAYNASSPATYGPEEPSPAGYPVALNSSVPVGSDPLYSELNSTYGNCDIYAPMWIMDTDNRYGFGQQEDGISTPSFINTFQRGSEESVWDTVDQPDWDTLKYGETGSGFLGLFNNGGGSFAAQYKYTDAPDADARLVQAAYWADQYATAQGNQSQIASTLADAAKLGDYVRYSMFDKYFKQIPAPRPVGQPVDQRHHRRHHRHPTTAASVTVTVTATATDGTGARGTAAFTYTLNSSCEVPRRLHRPGSHPQHRDDHHQRMVADLHLPRRREDHQQLQRRLLPDRGERHPHQRQLQRHHRARRQHHGRLPGHLDQQRR
ncbi:MAG: cellulose 1,4-beta-cellobiosidase [Actinomycetia bacterium]|nr:cellulose 1,4-beta-cellobiosidase [Actinomycetes bacterium]